MLLTRVRAIGRATFTVQGCVACLSSSASPIIYHDDYIKRVLRDTKTIAMVGASTNWNRPSYFAMKYLIAKGYRVLPINPIAAAKGDKLLGETVYASLDDVPDDLREQIDMVDIFRKSSDAGGVVDDAIRIGAETVWMQLEVVCEDSRKRAEDAGLNVVMDRCPKIEFSRLFGELGWHGFNSKVISSKRRPIGGGNAELKKSSDHEASDTQTLPPEFDGFATRAIHAGAAPCPTTGARVTPIYQNTSYVFDDVEHAASLFNLQTFGNIYGRLSNPTTAVLEERVANLENGRGATCTSSGHAAQLLALFALMEPGDRIVSSNKLYGGSITQFGKTIGKFGWSCDFVDVDDFDAVRTALEKEGVKALWCESLANPGGVVSDLERLSELTREVGVPLICDNTMATPYLCQPIEHGADLVVHSTTKFISGHGNAMGGCVVDSGKFDWAQNDKFPSLAQPEPAYHGLNFFETFGNLAFTTFSHAVSLRDLGPTQSPMNASITLTGIESLPLRMDRHVANARQIADFLDQHDGVSWVSYAGLQSSPYYDLALRYLPKGPGSVFTVGLKGGFESGVRAVERCRLFSHLANIGDTRSLVLHPASTTHRQLTTEQREACGAGDDVLRLSIGIESVEDLIADLDYALG
jgi:O-acetylhomoserine (thiol)-lyase